MLSISHFQLSFFHCTFPYPIVSGTGIASMIELDSELCTLDVFETKCRPTRPIVALFTGMGVAGLLVLSVY